MSSGMLDLTEAIKDPRVGTFEHMKITPLTRRFAQLVGIALAAMLMLGFSSHAAEKKKVLRIGHFPNLTHAQGVIGHGLTRTGKGWFEQRLGPGVEIQWFVYNAGPSAMEAIMSGAIDATYVGPNPA